MSTETDVFNTQAELLRKAARICESLIAQVDELGESLPNDNLTETERMSAIYIFTSRSLNLYKDTLDFLADEIERDSDKYYFLLPHLRTLLDIYARLLHLVADRSDENSRALVCIGYQLLTYKIFGQAQYQETLNVYGNFLPTQSISFPTNEAGLDFVWLRNQGLVFPNRRKVLTFDKIKPHSLQSLQEFPKYKDTYAIYSHMSEILHGNPYYYWSAPHNERFWVVATAISNSAFFIELVSTYILKKPGLRDLRTFLSEIRRSRFDFESLWQQRFSPKNKARNSASWR